MTSFVHNQRTHLIVLLLSTAAAMVRSALVMGVVVLLFAPTSNAFDPSGMSGLRPKSSAAVSHHEANRFLLQFLNPRSVPAVALVLAVDGGSNPHRSQ